MLNRIFICGRIVVCGDIGHPGFNVCAIQPWCWACSFLLLSPMSRDYWLFSMGNWFMCKTDSIVRLWMPEQTLFMSHSVCLSIPPSSHIVFPCWKEPTWILGFFQWRHHITHRPLSAMLYGNKKWAVCLRMAVFFTSPRREHLRKLKSSRRHLLL